MWLGVNFKPYVKLVAGLDYLFLLSRIGIHLMGLNPLLKRKNLGIWEAFLEVSVSSL